MKKLKHIIRDTIIFLVSITGISFVHRAYIHRRGPLVRVLCFHDVPDYDWFESVVSLLHKKYNLVTPEQFHRKDFHPKKINLLLTFDDGYQSWIDVALPVLQTHQAKGLFFISSGLLDVAYDTQRSETYMNKNLLITPKKPLSWEGAQTLVREGHTIGGHTVSHPNLARLSEAEVNQELKQNKQQLENKLNISLSDFAYTFGQKEHFNQSVSNLAQKIGYTHLYSAVSGFVITTEGDIPRTLIEKKQNLWSLQQWIKGGYDVFKSIV